MSWLLLEFQARRHWRVHVKLCVDLMAIFMYCRRKPHARQVAHVLVPAIYSQGPFLQSQASWLSGRNGIQRQFLTVTIGWISVNLPGVSLSYLQYVTGFILQRSLGKQSTCHSRQRLTGTIDTNKHQDFPEHADESVQLCERHLSQCPSSSTIFCRLVPMRLLCVSYSFSLTGPESEYGYAL